MPIGCVQAAPRSRDVQVFRSWLFDPPYVNLEAIYKVTGCAKQKIVEYGGMKTAREIVAHLGQRSIATALGVSVQAVSVAVTRGTLPSAWLPIVRQMCAAEGIACPERAFGFKFPSPEHSDGPPLCEPKNCREPSE